jgi:hypothetical protein
MNHTALDTANLTSGTSPTVYNLTIDTSAAVDVQLLTTTASADYAAASLSFIVELLPGIPA